MNIRDKFLKTRNYCFEETNFSWHENPVLEVKQYNAEDQEYKMLKETEVYLGITKEPLIFLNDLKLEGSNLKPDFLIFASRHTSQTARPAFLIHSTGNWGMNADFGGDSQTLSYTSALLLKAGFLSLVEKQLPPIISDFSFDIEVTHHGPTSLEIPLVFMELGSSKIEWKIPEAGEFVATAIINTLYKYLELNKERKQEICLGFGGTHYAPNFNRLIKTNDVALSFICPKYYIQELSPKMISQMIQNTAEKVDSFVIDWKGTNSADKKHLIPLLEEYDIPIKRTKDF